VIPPPYFGLIQHSKLQTMTGFSKVAEFRCGPAKFSWHMVLDDLVTATSHASRLETFIRPQPGLRRSVAWPRTTFRSPGLDVAIGGSGKV
jgi:hypothetical protein